MRVTRILPFIVALLCSFPLAVSAGDVPPAPEWDTVLDGIHAFTWRGRADLDAEVKKQEARIKQDLPGYIAAWERRMAVPIAYTGKERTGDACGPLSYCAADFLDARQLTAKLREQKEPAARFLFGKLSPDAQKAIAGADGSSAQAVQLLAGELTRIVRADALYTPERFAGTRLSPAALALVTEHNNAQNRVCANKTVLAEAFPGELARNFKCVVQKDESYRRVVAARTVQYLRTGDKKTLDAAIALGENLENRLIYTDFAFWYYYPRALADIQAGNAAALNYDAYALLNNVVLSGEPLEAGKSSPAEREHRYYTLNLADLVLTRGIMDARMEGLEALGPAVWLLGYRNGTDAGGAQERELLQRIVDVRKFLTGPESDNFRLNYAVAMREGEKRFALLTQALDAREKGAAVEKLFNETRDYLRLAYAWAGTGQGKSTAVSHYLELVNLALTKMKDSLPPAAYASLAETPDKVSADVAVALYRQLAENEKSGWEQLRFIDRKAYINSAQRLWNALRRNSLLVGDYYLQKMDKDDFQSVMDNCEPAEKAYLRYVNLFDAATAHGYREIIPDSAYFAYAATLKKLSRLKRTIYSYNKNIELNNQSITYLSKALLVYPYDDSIAEYAALTRNINTGSIGMLPDTVISTLVANNAIAKCLQGNTNYCDKGSRQALEWNIYKVRNQIYGSDDGNRLDDLNSLVRTWKNDARAPGKTGAKLENQRDALFAAAERFGALAGQMSTLAAGAMAHLNTCSAAGTACEETRDERDRLLAGKDDLEKSKNELIAACAAYRQLLGAAPGGAESGKELDYLTNLATLVNDVYVSRTDQVLEVGIQKKLYELRTQDNHPMHKIIKVRVFSS